METGRIILLNGVSSSGKTTLARALVKRLPDFFHFSIDDFDLLIERMEDRPKDRLIPIATEIFFHQAIAMFADRGVSLVVDHILHDPLTRADIFSVLGSYPVLFAGVHCPVEVLARREAARGDRAIGQGQKQLAFVHHHERYDVEVDTFHEPVEACVEKIIACLEQGRFPDGWLRTQAEFRETG